MLKLENTEVLGWEHAIRGMRNPMNSWEKSDSGWCPNGTEYGYCYADHRKYCPRRTTDAPAFCVGPNDLDLMKRLRNAGTDHRKFMRMITVYVDLTAPLYWWKEFDTYKVGTVANSCSTMHKIAAKEFTLEDFSHDHLIDYDLYSCNEIDEPVINEAPHISCGGIQLLNLTINVLNYYRNKYLETNNKKYWWQMIQLLPSSYNQRRTVQMNYEVLANIYKSRRNHKLDEWHTFCDWIEGLPYSELITGMTESERAARLGKELSEGFKEGFKSVKVPGVEEMREAFANALGIDKSVLFGKKAETSEDIEDSVDVSHLVDITCLWDVEELGGERIYAIRPGFTREDLTPYELQLLEKSEEYRKREEE